MCPKKNTCKMKPFLSCKYKTDKILTTTHQAMPRKAPETAKSLGIDKRKFIATRGWCEQLTVTI